MKVHKTAKCVRLLNEYIYKQYGLIGSTFYSNKCGKFKVLRKLYKNNYEIQFLYTNEIYIVNRGNIIPGEIKDYLYPTIYGVACLGKECKELKRKDKILYNALLMRYYGIISRCYSPIDDSYQQYGKLGIRVSNKWLNFSNFYKDIISMENFDRERFLKDYIAIDKDKKQINIPIENRIYSKETVSLLDRKENNVYRDNVTMGEKHSIYFICKCNGIETIEKNMAKFAREHSVDIKHIRNVLYGVAIPKKYNFRYPTNKELEKILSGELKVGDIIK